MLLQRNVLCNPCDAIYLARCVFDREGSIMYPADRAIHVHHAIVLIGGTAGHLLCVLRPNSWLIVRMNCGDKCSRFVSKVAIVTAPDRRICRAEVDQPPGNSIK